MDILVHLSLNLKADTREIQFRVLPKSNQQLQPISLPLCMYFFKWAYPVLFLSFSTWHNSNKLIKLDNVLESRTLDGRMEGADKSSELWRHPIVYVLKTPNHENKYRLAFGDKTCNILFMPKSYSIWNTPIAEIIFTYLVYANATFIQYLLGLPCFKEPCRYAKLSPPNCLFKGWKSNLCIA